MSLFSRFFGKSNAQSHPAAPLVANPDLTHPLSLTLLFDGALALDQQAVLDALRAFDPSLGKAQVELEANRPEGHLLGLAGWGKHVVKLVGFNAPMPAEALEACVAPAHYPQAVKDQARAHGSHVILYYGGYEEARLEHYVALAAVAGALSRLGASLVLNEAAKTSLPAAILADPDSPGDYLALLRALPLLMLFCGFVKYEVEGTPGVWMRTYGAEQLDLPNFAALAQAHDQGQWYFEVFGNILSYLQESGAEMASGHSMQVGDDKYFLLREPSPEEYFLHEGGPVFVTEIVGADGINQPA